MELRQHADELAELGVQVIAIAPDRPELAKETRERNEVDFVLAADGEMLSARAFGVAFEVDPKTADRYKGFGIDLKEWSGADRNVLPVPAVFLIHEGRIAFQYVNPQYQVRLASEVVVAAARSILVPEESEASK